MATIKYLRPEDFLLDPSFQNFVRRSNALDVQKWEQWVLLNRDKAEIFQQAIKNLMIPKAAEIKKGLTIL
jgi:hypothetical protein